MPSRPATAAIILFWLVTTGVLIYRELGQRFLTGEAPPFTIPLTAEVGENRVHWTVIQKGQAVGNGATMIKLDKGRTFKLSAKFSLERLNLLLELQKVDINASYHVTEEGRLMSSEAKLAAQVPLLANQRVELKFSGDVKDRMFHPQLKLSVAGSPLDIDILEPFPVSDSGNILNPMHLVHKISGLREGQRWPIPLMDPLRAIPEKFKGLLPVKAAGDNHLIASVTRTDLAWPKDETVVSCFKIEYAKPDERPLAATWVRRADDAVLQQWASYEGMEYTVRRAPE